MISHSPLSRAPQGSIRHLHWSIVVRVRPRTSGSITDLLLALACTQLEPCAAPQRSNPGALGRHYCADPPHKEVGCPGGLPYKVRDQGYYPAEISPVIGINQTNHSTDQERPCTTFPRIKKEHSICPSQLGPDLVTFRVLGQIKPHTPRLVVPFRQFL